jgi:hypothetical protein
LQWGQFSAILTLPFHRCLQQKKQITHRTSFKFSCASTHDASRHDTRKFDIRDSTLTASLAWFLARAKSRWFPLVITPRARAQFKQACQMQQHSKPPELPTGESSIGGMAWMQRPRRRSPARSFILQQSLRRSLSGGVGSANE